MAIPERRVHPRMAATVALRYGKEDEFNAGELVDVSAGGIGITGERVYPVGTELELRFRARQSNTDLLSLRAVVRHAGASKRMGLEFLNVPTSDFSRTLSMIERLAASQHKQTS